MPSKTACSTHGQPTHQVAKPRWLHSTRRALTDLELTQIYAAARTSGNDVDPHASRAGPLRRARLAIVSPMFDTYTKNDLLLSMMSTLTGDDADLEPVEKAFRATSGDFRAKFTAAVRARLAELVAPEVFIDLPERPDQLRKADLDRLVRPAADGFLSSYATKDDLLRQVDRIRRRQEQRPDWIPRIDRDGKPLTPPETDSTDAGREPDRPLAVAALVEIGEVTVLLPEAGEDRPELPMAPGGVGEWESALYSLLGLV